MAPADESTHQDNTHSQDRPMRSDARRNREKLITAARAALGRDGSEASLEGIARDAGVGIGTLYRNFPTRDELLEAVYGAELTWLTESATELLETMPAEAALREWVNRYAQFTAAKRGMRGALVKALVEESIPKVASRERLTTALTPILIAGAKEGTLRSDIDPDDVAVLLLGTFLGCAASGSTTTRVRLHDLVIDALRVRA